MKKIMIDDDAVKDLRHMLAPAGLEQYISDADIKTRVMAAENKHAIHDAALVMVSERHAKFDLVDLTFALMLMLDTLKAERAEAVAACVQEADMFDDVFAQCCSNPITNAWGKPVDMTKFNDACHAAKDVVSKQKKEG